MVCLTVEDLTDCGATLGLQLKACLLIYVTRMRESPFLTNLFCILSHETFRRSRIIPGNISKLTYGHKRDMLTLSLSSFICNNYAADDEIFLFGFSRGAFTARSIAGLIAGVGLLTKAGLPSLAEVFKDFENRENPYYRPANPDSPFPDKPSASDPRYEEELGKRKLSRIDIDIKVVGVWDTVGKNSFLIILFQIYAMIRIA